MGLTTSMDLSLPGLTSESAQADWKTILQKVLPYVDVFLPSLEELLLLLHRAYYMDILQQAGADYAIKYIDLSILPDLADEVLAMGPKVFGIKLGEKGIYLRTAQEEAFASFGRLSAVLSPCWYGRELLELPYRPNHFCSANGAGDTAIAGFLAGMMDGCGPEDCLHLATGAAACRIETGNQKIASAEVLLRSAQRLGKAWRRSGMRRLDKNSGECLCLSAGWLGGLSAVLRRESDSLQSERRFGKN